MDQWIISDPSVMLGKPVVTGTRITVESILERPVRFGSVGLVAERTIAAPVHRQIDAVRQGHQRRRPSAE